MEKESFILSCKRFLSPHSFDRIAQITNEIHLQYQIKADQVVATVTDNASNFVKAFKEFGIIADGEIFEEVNIENEKIKLPNHVRCASHTFNLIGTTDYINILNKHSIYDNHLKVSKLNVYLLVMVPYKV